MTVFERLQKFCNAKGISITALCLQATGNKGNLATWKNNNGHMRSDYLLKCADILGVSTDCLLGRGANDNSDQQAKVNVEFSRIFNQNEDLTKYAFYLWEALNEIYSTNKLFVRILSFDPFGRKTDLLVVFKYNMIVLCEAAKLIIPQGENKILQNIRNALLEGNNTQSAFEEFMNFWEENRKFFTAIRNNTVHYDHARSDNNKYYLSTIEKLSEYTLFLDKNILSDAEDPLFIKIIAEIYESCYGVAKPMEENEIYEKIVGLYSELCNYTIELLRSMVDSFLERFTTLSDNNEIQTLSYLQTGNLTIQNTGNNNGFVGQANAPVTVINGTENELSEQETALLDIFKKLNVIKQAQLLSYAAELEKDV